MAFSKLFTKGITIELLEAILAALDDLKAAVDANTTAVNAAVAKLGTVAGSVSAADVESAVATINANNTALTNATNAA